MTSEISAQAAVDSLIDALHRWLTQLTWYPGCEVTSVAEADDGYITCKISGGTNQRCGWKKLFSVAVGDYVDVLYDPRSMRWEVFKPGGAVIWSTSNWNIDRDCIRAEYTNNATGTLSLGEVVVFDSTMDYAVTTTTSSGDIDVAGVVLVGAASGATVEVAILGHAAVYVDGNVTRGQFLKTSAARGFATPTSTFDQGVFGIALTANAAGSSGTVDAFLVGHCWEGAGGSGAPTDAQYLTLVADATLTDERVFVDGDGLTGTDGGAGGNYTLDIDVSDFAGDGLEDDGGENLQVDSTVVRTTGNQTIAGEKTFQEAFWCDDGAGDSPPINLVGGTNNDIVQIKLTDLAVAGTSYLNVRLAGDTTSSFSVYANGGSNVFGAYASGKINIPIGPVDLNGIADVLQLDADGDTTISAPTDDEIDIEVGGSDIAEWKAGGLYGASGMDVYPEGDGGGLFQRSPNHWRTPTDHFNAFAGYTWAAYAPFDSAPNTVDVTTYLSILRLMNDDTTEDHYAYQSGHDSKIFARLTKGVDSYVGIRIQDSGDDNNDFVELRLIDGTTTGFFAIEIEYDVGGVGPTGPTTLVDDIPPQFYLLQLAKIGNTVYAYYTVDTPILVYIGNAAGMTWTMDRAGIVFGQRVSASSGSRAGLVDFVEVD